MTPKELEDSFGRRTIFTGELLVSEHTDTSDGRKPQWLEVEVWRTEGGSFVVSRNTNYRIRHSSTNCSRAEGYDMVEAGTDDTYLCTTCNRSGSLKDRGLAQASRISVDTYRTVPELINSFEQDGRYTHLARAILSDLSGKDSEIDAAWNTVRVD